MRQAAEHAIGSLGNFVGREIFELQMEPAGERRMNFTDRRRFSFPRRERGDLDFRMAQQNANQLERRVTGRTKDRYTNHLYYLTSKIDRLIESRILAMNSLDRYSAADALCGSLRKGTTAVLMGFAHVGQAVSLTVHLARVRLKPDLRPMPTPELEILYDNGPCLVVNKPPGVLTQAPAGIDSMEVRVKAFYREREQKEGNIYLGLPHRLDRPVSGAIVFARHVRAAQRLVQPVRESHGDEGLLGGCRRRRSAG